ncbi:MAG: hypothetical protein HMLKMBBP_03355 [Planctomycetes bacterium]|nr:hypothetical protein [Planctomycetota bacterium]
MPAPLPVDEALPRLAAALRDAPGAVLRAPPGAGKTTRVPPALASALPGRVVVLEPRRIAARAAARRIAEERGWTPGREVGWHVRFERKATRDTRILVVTEGVFLRMLADDPFLDGVGAVVFDEFHERNLGSDLALAMVRRVQRDARPDLRVTVMSATLDCAPIAAFLGGGAPAPVVESAGFLHPVDVRHLDRPDDRRIEDRAAGAARTALAATTGDVLVFLPGAGEIRATSAKLSADAARAGVDLVPLYGDLPAEQQDAALRSGPRRRIVLATNVAETSVTVEGVTAVVDTGLARVQRFDPSVGLDALVLERISRASADQRTGRAGRTAPGVCFRLWTRHEERAMPERAEPEVRRVDLAGAALELLAWGERDLAAFPWFEAPDTARLATALDLLGRLGAVDGGTVTETGRAMVRMPVHPRAARLLVEGHRLGRTAPAALAAALLTERDPVVAATRPRAARIRSDSDVLDRMDAVTRFERRGARASAIGDIHEGGARFVLRARDQLLRTARDALGPEPGPSCGPDTAVLRAVFAGWPDRLAKRRGAEDRRAVLVTGGGVRLADESAVDAELFVAVDVDASRGDALVRRASAVRAEWIPEAAVTRSTDLAFDAQTKRITAMRRTRVGAIVLDEAAVPPGDDERVASLLAEAALADPRAALDLDDPDSASFLARVRWLRDLVPDLDLPDFDGAALRDLVTALAAGRRSFDELRRAPLLDHLRGALTRTQALALDREAPSHVTVPSGSRIALRYERGRPPVLAVRIQELFGLREAPRIGGGRSRIVLHLLGPNHRPQQVTDDLASFWANTYPDVRKELKRRYPRHAWPEDPLAAAPERRPQRRKS